MPLYDYQCSQCQAVTEIRHGFDANHTDPCPKCGGALKRVFNPAPILFKGSGFYITDSRPPNGAAASESKPAEPKPESKSSDSAA